MKKLGFTEQVIFATLMDTFRCSLPVDRDTEDECIGHFNNTVICEDVHEDEPTLKLRPSS